MIKKLLLIVAVILVQKASAQITLTEKNIDAVLKQMTLQEKADLLIGCIEGTNYFEVPQPTGTYIVEICEDAETIKISMPLRIKDTTKYAVNNVLNN